MSTCWKISACLASCILVWMLQVHLAKEMEITNPFHNAMATSFSPPKRHTMLSLDEKMWQGNAGRDISVCVIVRTWVGHTHCLGAMLATLAAGAHPDVSVFLVDTGRKEAFTSLHDIVEQFNINVGFKMARISERTSNNSRPLFPAIGDMEDWGYIATDMAISDMLQRNKDAVAQGFAKPCQTLYITNGDNIMGKGFFLHTLHAVAKGHNIVATHFIHRMADYQMQGHTSFTSDTHMHATNACGGWRPGVDAEFFTQFRRVCVDLAAVVTNASMWEQDEGGIRFLVNRLVHANDPPLMLPQQSPAKQGMIHAPRDRGHAMDDSNHMESVVRDSKDHMRDTASLARKRDELKRQIFTADGSTFALMAKMKGANPLVIRRTLIFHQ
jgi:hypothetical protein